MTLNDAIDYLKRQGIGIPDKRKDAKSILFFLHKYPNLFQDVLSHLYKSDDDLNWMYKNLFDAIYPYFDNHDISEAFHKSESAIRTKASRLGLKKVNVEWNSQDDLYLLEKYNVAPIEEIMNKLQRSRWGIINRYRVLKNLK